MSEPGPPLEYEDGHDCECDGCDDYGVDYE